jgi:dihydrofolate reductase
MCKIVVVENLSLDGVMQAPGRPDEDLRGGFEHGGWAMPYNDPIKGQIMAEGMSQAGPLLFGRRTYEDFFSVWPERKDNPFTRVLDNAQKFVASTTLTEPLPWCNSTLLKGDVTDALARLKEQPGKDLVVMGSGELVGSLIRHRLVDEYVLMIHPLVLGSGRRLFPDEGSFATLRLVDAKPTTTGVVIATYRPGGMNVRENTR